ncbi:hypothetical protein MFLO_04735 [Listeria floridensis FSL S10-1187]|uniref:Uncharacterized protein n=1 Tax=Listeria floridensis FSL S10-1187 TaxID=1265817 RepID=A0ABN0RGF7_9LIST|nr:hypothetical protein [Listeria floridensis]EUJ32903.1 hypothetical protein MFLO_04735 [Listeria floridensis FSL S10-1187]
MAQNIFIVNIADPSTGGVSMSVYNRLQYQVDHDDVIYNIKYVDSDFFKFLKKMMRKSRNEKKTAR